VLFYKYELQIKNNDLPQMHFVYSWRTNNKFLIVIQFPPAVTINYAAVITLEALSITNQSYDIK